MNETEGKSITLDIERLSDREAYHLSSEAKYLCLRDKYSYKFIEVSTGSMVNQGEVYYSDNILWHSFVSSTKMIGVTRSGPNKYVYTLDVSSSNLQPSEIRSELSFKKFNFDSTGKSCVAEKGKELFFIDLDRRNDPVVILSNYDRIVKKNVNFDRTSVLFVEEDKYYFALFVKSERKFKVAFNLEIEIINPAIYSNDKNQIFYYEKDHVSRQKNKQASSYLKSRILTVDKNGFSEINFDTEVKFHHPYIFYIYDNNEIWMHKINEPLVIHRFVLINHITAIDYLDDVYLEKGIKRPRCSFVCLLTYGNIHKLAEFTFRQYPELEKNGKPKFPDGKIEGCEEPISTFVMDRFQKNVNVGDVRGDIISISVLNIGSGSDYFIMFHYLNRVEFYDSRTDKVVHKISMRLGKRNIVKFEEDASDAKNTSNIFFWEDNGRFIERLQLPVSGNLKFKTFNAYNSVDSIRLCKKIYYEQDDELKKALLV